LIRDNPGRPVPEGTFTHSHLSESTCFLYHLSPLASNHQFYYLTGKHKMFNVTVAAKYSQCMPKLNTQNCSTDLLSIGQMYVKKFISFCQVLKICTQKKTASLRNTIISYLDRCNAESTSGTLRCIYSTTNNIEQLTESFHTSAGWLGSRVVSVLDSGTEGPGSNRSRNAVV